VSWTKRKSVQKKMALERGTNAPDCGQASVHCQKIEKNAREGVEAEKDGVVTRDCESN
jgi:hypothetical protein